MPLADWRCDSGHVAELVRPIGLYQTACPECGGLAQRQFSGRVGIKGPTTDLRNMTRRYLEASAEVEHRASQVEAATGQPVQTPSVWQVAKQRAAQMQRAGMSAAPPKD